MKRKVIHFFVSLMILAVGIGVSGYLIATKPEVKKRRPKYHPPVVEIINVKKEDVPVYIKRYASVFPEKKTVISSELSGRIIYVSPNLKEGKRVKKGEILVKIDPRDYEAMLASAKANLKQAISSYKLLKAQAKVAIKEWKSLHDTPVPELVAKKPQLEAALANIKAAEANVRSAKIKLSKTKIRSPFSGYVTRKFAEIGQFIAPGTRVAEIYSDKKVEVRAKLALGDLNWIDIPGFNADKGSNAEIIAYIGKNKYSWQGVVTRTTATIDEKTRTATVIIDVEKPFSTSPPLMPGMFVDVIIKGKIVKNAYRIPRAALRFSKKGVSVWTVNDSNIIEEKKVKVIKILEKDLAVVKGNLKDQERVVISKLSILTPGTKVVVRERKQ